MEKQIRTNALMDLAYTFALLNGVSLGTSEVAVNSEGDGVTFTNPMNDEMLLEVEVLSP